MQMCFFVLLPSHSTIQSGRFELTRLVHPPVANVTSYLVGDNRSIHQCLLAKHPGKASVKYRLSETVPWYKGPISERQYSVSRDDVT